MFPLTILPVPGELVPLHIFEPRYRQLLQDLETNDITFGIYCSHEINKTRIGSLMRLESVIKRYPGGESDIIVRCQDNFTLDLLLRRYKDKLYPGGDVTLWDTDLNELPSPGLYAMFVEYLRLRRINEHVSPFSVYQVAHELNLDVQSRYKFLTLNGGQRESFLSGTIRFQTHVLHQEEKSRDLFHLN